MKIDISNKQLQTVPLLFLLFGLTIASIIIVLFFNEYSRVGKIVSIGLLLLFGLLPWYYSMRFHKVSFDSEFLYISRFSHFEKVALEKVHDIRSSVFPLPSYYLKAYVVTITYIDNGVEKKIRFLSRVVLRDVGSVRGIPHLDRLRQAVVDKKHGR